MGTLANFHFDLKTEVTLNVSNAEAVTSLNVKWTEKGQVEFLFLFLKNLNLTFTGMSYESKKNAHL